VGHLHYPTALVRLFLRLNDFGQPNPDEIMELAATPVEYTVERNHYNEADTATVTVDFEDFPFDARIVRGGTLLLYQADAGSPDPDFWEKQTRDQLMTHGIFAGVVDEAKTVFDDEWRRCEFKCRDYTAYFLDVSQDPAPISYVKDGQKVSLGEILKKVIEQIPNAKAIVPWPDDGINLDGIFPADYKVNGTDPKLGKRNKKEGETAWEALQHLFLEAGLVLYVERDVIRVRKPSTILLDQSIDEDLFFRFAIGANLSKLESRRQMGRQHGINVQVVSVNDDKPERLVAIAPEDPKESQKAELPAVPMTGDAEPLKKPTTQRGAATPYAINGITDQAVLQEIANQLYELLRHHELEGEVETDDMVDSRGRSVNELQYGEPIVFDVAGHFRSLIALDRASAARHLLERGYPAKEAEQIATALDSQRVPFYVHAVAHHFSSEDDGGYDLRVEFRSRKELDFSEAAS
jgi:hypothetical protein